MDKGHRRKTFPRPQVLHAAQDRQWAELHRSLGPGQMGDGQGDCGSAVMALSGLFAVRAITQLAPMPAQPSITSPNC